MGIREIEIAGNNLIIHELDDVYESVTGRALTGSWLWDSAVILAHYIATHLDFENKSVIELGAGAGLPGLTAATLGASRVVLTDVKALVPGLINNVEANGLGSRIEVRELVWGLDESELSQLDELGEFDFVVMSDVFFDPEEMVGLGKTLKWVCGRGTKVCAASEVRPWTGECLNELVSQGFTVIELSTQLSGDPSGEDQNLDVFAVYELVPPMVENCQMADICA